MFQNSPKDESGLLKAVKNVHKMIDEEIAAGTNPNNVFVCGFSQGGLSFPLCSCKRTCTCTHRDRSTCMISFSLLVVTCKSNFFFLPGALTLASVLLYPKTLGGGAVFSGWLPFNSSIIQQITPEAKRVRFREL